MVLRRPGSIATPTCTLVLREVFIIDIAAIVDVCLLVERLRPLVEAVGSRAEGPHHPPQPIAQLEPRIRRRGRVRVELTGLWRFTVWGTSPLDKKLTIMMSALDDALGDRKPEGIVLRSTAGLATSVTEETAETHNGVALRRVIRPLRARETLIMGFSPSAEATIPAWQALTEAEGDWLDWALDQYELPSIDEILPPPPG